MNSTMMTMTMNTMAPALATHRNSRQDHNFPTMAAADFQHLPLLEMPKQGGALADLLRREVCGLVSQMSREATRSCLLCHVAERP